MGIENLENYKLLDPNVVKEAGCWHKYLGKMFNRILSGDLDRIETCGIALRAMEKTKSTLCHYQYSHIYNTAASIAISVAELEKRGVPFNCDCW